MQQSPGQGPQFSLANYQRGSYVSAHSSLSKRSNLRKSIILKSGSHISNPHLSKKYSSNGTNTSALNIN